MKRDFDVLRAVLLKVEAIGDPEEPQINSLSLEGIDQPITNEHVKLAIESELIEGICKFSTNNRILLTTIRGLTPRGYDFLDNVRNDAIWGKIKNHVASTVGTASLEVIEKFASQIISAAVSRPNR